MKNTHVKTLSLSLLFALSLSMVGCNKVTNYNLHTEEQTTYLQGDPNLISLYADGTKELSRPGSVALDWKDFSNKSYNISVSKSEKFDDLVRSYLTDESQCVLYNLEINETYYWYAFNDDGETKVQSFTTESLAPRSLYVDGITNARDLGGYKTDDGSFTKQGLIYRTSRFNENETTSLLISESGINEMVKGLNIKTELDLRRVDNNETGGITTSPLGNEVNYISVPMKSGGNIILLNKDIIKDVFKVFGNKENYPIVMHCSIGTDRTGMIAFLINALLGVSEEDLYRDYLFSNFANIGGNRTPSTIKGYIDTFKYSDGKTLAEKTKSYLIEIGVSEEDINTVIEMMN